MKILKISGLLILVCLVIFLGSEFVMREQGNDATEQSFSYYQEKIEALESELACVKTEKYEAIAVYREQVEALRCALTEARGSYTYMAEGDKVTLT